MKTRIYTLKLALNRCYLLDAVEGLIMIDGGPRLKGKAIERYLTRHGIDPKSINLIILTHADFDHAGSAKAVKELTGAPVAIHEAEKDKLKKGKFSWPPGVNLKGKVFRALFTPLLSLVPIPPLEADIILDDNDFPLAEYGIRGRIVHTPGHTPGSVSVILDEGFAFIGCLAHNSKIFRAKTNLPVFAEDTDQIRESWNKILMAKPEMLYPGHGKPFPLGKTAQFL